MEEPYDPTTQRKDYSNNLICICQVRTFCVASLIAKFTLTILPNSPPGTSVNLGSSLRAADIMNHQSSDELTNFSSCETPRNYYSRDNHTFYSSLPGGVRMRTR